MRPVNVSNLLLYLACGLLLLMVNDPQRLFWLGNLLFIATLLYGSLRWPLAQSALATFSQLFIRLEQIRPLYFVGFFTLTFFLSAAMLSQLLYGGLPHVADTHAQYVHAKIMASGHLHITPHPLWKFFEMQYTISGDRFYSGYPPGHLFMLALGHLLHVPWLVNPFIGALTVIAVYLLTQELGGRAPGYIAAALFNLSPFILFISAEYMNHVTALLFFTLFLYFYFVTDRTGSQRHALLAGLCGGYAFISRPQTLLTLALPIALHGIWQLWREPERHWRNFIVIAGGVILFALFLFEYNILTSGDPLIIGDFNPWTKLVLPLFDAGRDHSYDWYRVVLRWSQMNFHLFMWQTSSLLFVFLLFLLRLQPRYGYLLIACCLLQVVMLYIIPYGDKIFGPRYLYETATILIALTAICITRLPLLIQRLYVSAETARGAMAVLVVGLCCGTFLEGFPRYYTFYGNNYWEGNASYYQMLMDKTKKPAVVFINHWASWRYVSFTMPPDDSNPILFAHDRRALNRQLMNYYPDRYIYSADNMNVWLIREPISR